MNKKWLIVAAVVVLVAVLGFAGYQRIVAQRATAEAPAETAVVRRGTLLVTVSATGRLVPRAEVSLAFTSGGQVVEVLVVEGQEVAAGEALARLDTADLERQLAAAEQTLLIQTASLEQLLDPDPSRVAAAEANLAAAYMGYRGQNQEYTVDLEAAGQRLDDEMAAVDDAQAARDSVVCEASDEAAETQRTLESAVIKAAAAQAGYDIVMAGVISDTQALPAWAKLAGAEKALRDLVDPDAPTLEIARAQVEQARIAVDQIQAQLDAATLTAPLAGTVTALRIQPGEMVGAAQPAVVLSDLATLEVEVNLDETDVARVAVGQEVQMGLDAFPGVELAGEVTYIAPMAQAQAGVVLYPVTIRLVPAGTASPVPVRAGMTAEVTIAVASKEDALLVPLRAIETEGEHATVQRLTVGQTERVEVTLGMMTDTQVEITSGLSEGDVVVVVAGPAQGSTADMGGLSDIFGGGD